MTAAAFAGPMFLQRRFFPLWFATCAGAFSDGMLRQALIIAFLYGAVSSSIFKDPTDAVPAIGALFSLTTLLCTSAAGQVAEKFETRFLLRRIKLAEVALAVVVAIGFAIDSGTLLMAAFVAFSAQIAFFNPARIAALPKYLHARELVRANAYCSAGMFVAVVLGILLGGVLVALPSGNFLVSMALLAVAVAAFFAALALPEAAADARDLKIDWNPVGQTVHILRHAFAEAAVWRPLLGVSFFYLVSTATTILVPLYAIEELGADGAAATSIMGVFAVGAGVGAIAASLISKRRSGLGFSFAGVLFASAVTALVYWLTDIVQATGASATVGDLVGHTPGRILLAGFALTSACMGLYLVPLQAAAQRRAPPARRARTLAAGNILNALAAMLGSLAVLSITNTAMSPAHGLLILAGLQLLIGVYMALRWFALPRGFHDEILSHAE